MNIYEYKDPDGDYLTLGGIPDAETVLQVKQDRRCMGIRIPNADVPTVAAELLKAAGHDELAALIEAPAAEKKLQERRDALAKDLNLSWASYEACSPGCRRAIDRIIALEDGKATA